MIEKTVMFLISDNRIECKLTFEFSDVDAVRGGECIFSRALLLIR
jgi:hypothetical protein